MQKTTDESDFVDWWYGTTETGKINGKFIDLPHFQDERAFITDNYNRLMANCPSIAFITVTVLMRKEVNGQVFFVGRLSDGRFLFVNTDLKEKSSNIVIAPKCGPPLDAPFREEKHNGDIGCTLAAITNPEKLKCMTNGCIGFVVCRSIETATQLFESLPFQ